MSRKVQRRKARIDELADELSIGAAIRLRCDSDDIHKIVCAVVDYLIEEYPAQDLYIPAGIEPRSYPVDAMRKALLAGRSVRSICQEFRIGRRTFYQLLDTPATEQKPAD